MQTRIGLAKHIHTPTHTHPHAKSVHRTVCSYIKFKCTVFITKSRKAQFLEYMNFLRAEHSLFFLMGRCLKSRMLSQGRNQIRFRVVNLI